MDPPIEFAAVTMRWSPHLCYDGNVTLLAQTKTMSIETWDTRQRWLYAIKPGSWPKLLMPMLLGQSLGIYVAGEVNLWAVLLGVLFTVFDGLFIVLMNDWGDQGVDRIKRKMFPDGCSPKTIPDGILPAGQIFAAGALAAVLAAVVAFGGELVLDRPNLGVAGVLCLGLFAAYTLPPIKLNYRGGGELLEALGVGVALPWINAYMQSGELFAPSYELLLGSFALALASALASGLSDEESDRAGGKRTFTTIFGNEAVKRATELSLRVGWVVWIVAAVRTDVQVIGVAMAAGVVAYYAAQVRAEHPNAVTNAFADLKRYKMHLHHAIWYGTFALSAALLAQYLIF